MLTRIMMKIKILITIINMPNSNNDGDGGVFKNRELESLEAEF
jgi:hypothetical protein